MIISILIMYCIVMCWWCYSWTRRNCFLKIKSNRSLLLHFAAILGFGILFIGFLRIINLFRETKSLDLNILVFEQNWVVLILVVILLYSLRRLLFYNLKLCWFRLHFFLMSPLNLGIQKKYRLFFFNWVYFWSRKSYNLLWYLNLILTVGQVFTIFFDLIFNHMVLSVSLSYLKYYAVFKLVYIFVKFLVTKLDVLLDYYSCRILYLGVVDEDPFYLDKNIEHLKLMDQAEKYCRSLVREERKYLKRK